MFMDMMRCLDEFGGYLKSRRTRSSTGNAAGKLVSQTDVGASGAVNLARTCVRARRRPV